MFKEIASTKNGIFAKYFTHTGEKIPSWGMQIIDLFDSKQSNIICKKLTSNGVLAELRPELEKFGYQVETTGKDGKVELEPHKYQVDAHNKKLKVLIEIEGSACYANNRFIYDLMKAEMSNDVDYLIVSAFIKHKVGENKYGKDKTCTDYTYVCNFIDQIFKSNILKLKGVLVIGYNQF